jgi:hypothetical protein
MDRLKKKLFQDTQNSLNFTRLSDNNFFLHGHIFQKNYSEVISKRILIIFAPEEAEIFKTYLLF